MNGTEFYKALQPAYSKWLESMDKADAINMAAEIAFVKEVMFNFDEFAGDVLVDDDIDPAWYLDECIEDQRSSPRWWQIFAGPEYFEGLVEDLHSRWKQYKKDHGRKFDDEENH